MMVRIVATLVAASAAIVLTACARVPVRSDVYSIASKFDVEQARALMQPGNNTIKGSALFRQAGGGIVTCAGLQVLLVPVTEYSAERFWRLYATDTPTRFNSSENAKFDNDPPEYTQLTRNTYCDAQGAFVFDRIADGEFFVATRITWFAARSIQGGNLIQRVRVEGGNPVAIVLTR